MANIALILAGGIGSRVGSDVPKQFLPLSNGKEIIISSIDAFVNHSDIDRISVVCHKDYINILSYLIKRQRYKKPISIVAGGETRQQSSFIGLSKLEPECNCNEDIVLIHDAARPFLSQKIISDNIKSASINTACTTVLPMQDTMLISEDGIAVSSIPDRSKMYAVQTPQSFKLSVILNAHRRVPSLSFTDDAGLLLSQGITVAMVLGDKRNLKITSSEDIDIANSFLAE